MLCHSHTPSHYTTGQWLNWGLLKKKQERCLKNTIRCISKAMMLPTCINFFLKMNGRMADHMWWEVNSSKSITIQWRPWRKPRCSRHLKKATKKTKDQRKKGSISEVNNEITNGKYMRLLRQPKHDTDASNKWLGSSTHQRLRAAALSRNKQSPPDISNGESIKQPQMIRAGSVDKQ